MKNNTALQEQKNTNITVVSFSEESLADLDKHEKAVKTALNGVDKNMEKIAFNLYWIYSSKAYKEVGFSTIADYAFTRFDLNKSSVYSFINLVERFGARLEDNTISDKFDSKYKGFSTSKLSVLIDLTDEQIEEFEIKPEMSVRAIKSRVKKLLSDCGDESPVSERIEKTEDAEPGGQYSMSVAENAVSLPASCTAETVENTVPDMEENDSECDDDGILGYRADTVYEFSIQDNEKDILKEIKAVLKKNRETHDESFFSLILRYPVRKGEQ